MTDRKPKNTNGPLTEFQCAERVCRIIAETNGTPLAEEVRIAIEKRRTERRAAANEQIAKLMARVPEGRRGHVAKHILAAGFELGGFEIAGLVANETVGPDAQQMAGDAVANRHEPDPDAFPDELPAGARPMPDAQRDRVARLTGASRK